MPAGQVVAAVMSRPLQYQAHKVFASSTLTVCNMGWTVSKLPQACSRHFVAASLRGLSGNSASDEATATLQGQARLARRPHGRRWASPRHSARGQHRRRQAAAILPMRAAAGRLTRFSCPRPRLHRLCRCLPTTALQICRPSMPRRRRLCRSQCATRRLHPPRGLVGPRGLASSVPGADRTAPPYLYMRHRHCWEG